MLMTNVENVSFVFFSRILLRVESLLIRTKKLEDELQTLKGDTQKKEDSEATESLSLKEKKRQ
jgi:hypothetical protein